MPAISTWYPIGTGQEFNPKLRRFRFTPERRKINGVGYKITKKDVLERAECTQTSFPTDMFGRPCFHGDYIVEPSTKYEEFLVISRVMLAEGDRIYTERLGKKNDHPRFPRMKSRMTINITDQINANITRKYAQEDVVQTLTDIIKPRFKYKD